MISYLCNKTLEQVLGTCLVTKEKIKERNSTKHYLKNYSMMHSIVYIHAQYKVLPVITYCTNKTFIHSGYECYVLYARLLMIILCTEHWSISNKVRGVQLNSIRFTPRLVKHKLLPVFRTVISEKNIFSINVSICQKPQLRHLMS